MTRSRRNAAAAVMVGLLAALVPTAPVTAAPLEVLSVGHVDGPGIGFADGEFDLHVHAEDLEAEFEPADAILEALPGAQTAVPNDPSYAFLGSPGDPVWVLPQTEDPNLLFLGIGAEELVAGTFEGDVVSLGLVAVAGPGRLVAYSTDPFGVPTVVFDSADLGLPPLTLTAGDHVHLNWAFTAPGAYSVDWQVDGVLVDETPVSSGPVTYRYQVSAIGPCVGGAPSVSVGDVAVSEDDTGNPRVAKFPVTLSQPAATLVQVSYSVDGAAAKVLKFNPGQTSKLVVAKVTPDVVAEPDESISVTLSSPTGGYVLGRAAAVATIVDDDVTPGNRITVGDASACEGDAGLNTKVAIPVTLAQPAAGTVTVQYSFVEDSAGAGTDFKALPGTGVKTLTFKPGQFRKFIVVQVLRDGTYEIDETFGVALASPVGSVIADDTGVVTILNDDPVPVA